MKKNYKYKTFPPFNDHGASCKGHANYMLDCDYANEEDRTAIIKVIGNYMHELSTV